MALASMSNGSRHLRVGSRFACSELSRPAERYCTITVPDMLGWMAQ